MCFNLRSGVASAAILLLAACSGSNENSSDPDAGDASVLDASGDASGGDAATTDTGDDTGSDDGGNTDTGDDDTGVADTGVEDTGVEDTGDEDAGDEDTGSDDADANGGDADDADADTCPDPCAIDTTRCNGDVVELCDEDEAGCLTFGAIEDCSIDGGVCDEDIDGAICTLPLTCSDGEVTGDETDIDCGGSCDPCDTGLGCATGNDCVEGVCDLVASVETIDFAPRETPETSLLLGDDELSGALPIGFEFDFYGVPFEEVFVSSNGFVTFLDQDEDGCCSGDLLPNGDVPSGLIAFYWTDLYPPGVFEAEVVDPAAGVFYGTVGEPGEREFILSFVDVPACCDAEPAVTSQVVLSEADGAIEVHTAFADNQGTEGGNITQGIESPDGLEAVFLDGRNSAFPLVLSDDGVRFTFESGTCAEPACGDFVINGDETCDDGNTETDDGCDDTCQLECGNGVLDGDEECDDGALNSDTEADACRTDCTFAACGDGVIDAEEECDDFGLSATCTTLCLTSECGDAFVNVEAGEECDLGEENSESPNAVCRTSCDYAICGDSIVDDLDSGFEFIFPNSTGCTTADHEAFNGDDRGGVAMTTDGLYVIGDAGVALIGLDGAASSAFRTHDGLFSNAADGTLWTLMVEDGPLLDSDEIDFPVSLTGVAPMGADGVPGEVLTFSDPVVLPYSAGVLAGWNELGLWDQGEGVLYTVDLSTGSVVVQPATRPEVGGFSTCENWAFWGLLQRDTDGNAEIVGFELDGGELGKGIVAYNIESLETRTLRLFEDMSDACSLSFAAPLAAWAFHYEGSGEFGGIDEFGGFCDAVFTPERIGEQCDDGNDIDDDECTNACELGALD